MAIVLNGTTGITTPAIDAGNDVGQVATFAMNTAPTGWLKANGALVSRTSYAALFAAIGTTFGAGDGSTTFALPDLRGEFIRGWDDGRGVDAGRVFGSSQADALQNITGAGLTLAGNGAAGTGAFSGSSNNAPSSGAGFGAGNFTTNINFSAANSPGVRTSTETRPTNVALLACIKF